MGWPGMLGLRTPAMERLPAAAAAIGLRTAAGAGLDVDVEAAWSPGVAGVAGARPLPLHQFRRVGLIHTGIQAERLFRKRRSPVPELHPHYDTHRRIPLPLHKPAREAVSPGARPWPPRRFCDRRRYRDDAVRSGKRRGFGSRALPQGL